VNPKNLRVVKSEIRVLGIDDGQFVPRSKNPVLVVGVVFRGGYWLDGIMSTHVTNDGLDATQNISDMITTSPHYKQLRVVMLNGITFAGFNVVDIKALHDQTGLPIIVVTTKKPNMTEVQAALKHLPNSEERWNAIINAGQLYSITTRNPKQKIYVETAGITNPTTEEVLKLTSTRSKIPEPLRVAHLIASGISLYTTRVV
jgi:uncharacterized protein